MKWLLILWGGPVLFLTSWYTLSYNDINFGIFMLSREANDLVFQLYGNVLGIDPKAIPPLVARAMIFDSFVVFGLLALRKRKAIIAWYQQRRAQSSLAAAARASDANLSSAP
ncbi:hypothetical protein ASG25_01400 [Rhizobium sp. Leaf384]|uniref:DUF6105 family protein n=1 Tax=unclassified Rhizobium TaxID=2613769 RepID=UPI000713BAE7|nr:MULTISPECIES: DUF6105 family protein [unclassified Rhizobium]KQS74113.1 hypothetical protein ASG58_16465 [Rhizobium sp. Leaf383]KQS80308.1 hypothetical protein ASG25_01400 [Rhizobium sp. Leaf384]